MEQPPAPWPPVPDSPWSSAVPGAARTRVVAVSLAAIVLLVAAAAAIVLLPRDDRLSALAQVASQSPDPSPAVAPEGESSLVAGAMPAVEVAGADPPDLPRFPSSVRVSHREDVTGGVEWTRVEYVAEAPVDVVRAHYRDALRRYAWFVGDVEVADDGWRFDAHRGGREVTLAIMQRGPGAHVSVSVSDILTSSTPTAAPREPQRTRTADQAPAAERAKPQRRVVRPADDDRREVPRRPARGGGAAADDDDDDDDDEDDDD